MPALRFETGERRAPALDLSTSGLAVTRDHDTQTGNVWHCRIETRVRAPISPLGSTMCWIERVVCAARHLGRSEARSTRSCQRRKR